MILQILYHVFFFLLFLIKRFFILKSCSIFEMLKIFFNAELFLVIYAVTRPFLVFINKGEGRKKFCKKL